MGQPKKLLLLQIASMLQQEITKSVGSTISADSFNVTSLFIRSSVIINANVLQCYSKGNFFNRDDARITANDFNLQQELICQVKICNFNAKKLLCQVKI